MAGSKTLPAAEVQHAAAPEWHIASLVVHAAPHRAGAAAAAIGVLPGACVHASAPSGKLVVTLEAGSAAQVLENVERIRGMAGVLSASLVYQHADTLQAMNEVLPDADRTSRLH